MRFGLQKLTLLDYPGMVACTVFSCGCNFRCPYCHNASLVNGSGEGLFTMEEVMDFLRKRRGILDGVCLTGGEPLLHSGALTFAAEAKAIGYKVKIDTNGSFPERLEEAVNAGVVDYIAMDIKNSPGKYAATAGNADILPKIKRSVEFIKSGRVDYEFRTTVTGNLHEKADFTAIGEWIKGADRYYLQPFRDAGDILQPADGYPVAEEKLKEFLTEARRFVPAAEIRGRE